MIWINIALLFLAISCLFSGINDVMLIRRITRLEERVKRLEDLLYWNLIKWEVAKKIGNLFGEKESDEQKD